MIATNAGRDAVAACFAHGVRERGGRSSRVVLSPRRWGQACEATRRRRWLTSPVHRGDHGAAVKPLRRECRMFRCPDDPCARFVFSAYKACGCIVRPAFPAPSDLSEGQGFLQSSGESRSRDCGGVSRRCLKIEYRCRPGQANEVSAEPGPICGRPPWHKSFLVRSDRLHPYVRPVECDRLDRWPRWFARCELQTTWRPVGGQWVPRTVSHR
jgi:hypothetical protein